ncbi:copper resistance CopC/CopD family protein [Streptomyces fulvoviolaceus]|uniref:copper resistance CopC/CopD family protein n=1 Tax=Streptomyces fulvoviolaceus TaxID=285535 RepID=UPI000997446F|nr:copper resistance protein CopC [Streptomyces fulvoviolaceus]
MTPTTTTVRRALLLLLLTPFLCALLSTPASAHTELVSASPKDGAELKKAPERLTLTFDEAVDVADVRVLTEDGDRLPVTRASKDGVRIALPTVEHGQRLAVVWSVVDEEDGHASSGRLSFTVGAAATPRAGGDEAVSPLPAPSPSVRRGLVAARWAGYLSLALFIGGLAFITLLWPRGAYEPRARALLGLAWTGGLLATVAAIGLQGAYSPTLEFARAGGPPSFGGLRDALRASTYADVLATEPGVVLAARGLMWVLAAVVLGALLQGGAGTSRSPGWRVGALAVTFGLLRTTGMTGHNSEGSEPTWGAVADVVHLLGASLWIGGLAMLALAVLPRRRPGELAVVVPGYSRLAAVSVTGIVVAGLVLAWQVVGSYDALLHTSYGHLLLIKTAVLGGVLLAAYASRQWVRTRLDLAVLLRGDAATVRPFGYSVAVETGLVLVVLVVTSLLVTADPGR